MKKTPLIAVLIGMLRIASAGTMNVYTEDWGTTNGGTSLTAVGWTGVTVTPNGTGPFLGIYQATGASDSDTGAPLPVNTVFLTGLVPTNQTAPAMIYTTDAAGNGGNGDSAFVDINPTLYTNLTLAAEVRGATTDTNYFAVQLGGVGGQWYVCTSFQMPDSTSLPFPVFTNATLIYTNPANVWHSLTINTTDVTIGAVASPNLSAQITGIGIVELPTSGGFNYNQLAVTAFAPNPPPPVPPSIGAAAVTPQTVFAGGGASFAIGASGTKPLTYFWQTNGVTLTAGGRYLGTATNTLTITNINANDALVTYSAVVTNNAVPGTATNSGLTLNVSPVPNNLLYAELFPYAGPTGAGNLPLGGIGWVVAAPGNTSVGIFQVSPGLGGIGDVFSFSPVATTNVYYTSDTNDIGLSGLPFVDINPNNYPAVSFQAGFVPGNGAGQVAGAVSVYWAVAMNGTWYCSAQPVPITLTGLSPYVTNQLQFNPAATNWNNLTITATGGTIGSQASSPLTGNITGAGLVVAHNTGSGSDMNFQNFEIITNAVLGAPPDISTNIPLAVTVESGGGASFGVAIATGALPLTYAWTTNGVLVQNGGRVSGANTATLTIADLTSLDDGMQIVAFVTNKAGFDQSDRVFGATTLTVANPPVGFVYSEAFPYTGPVGNFPLSSVGWAESGSGTPNVLFQTAILTSSGAAFAFLGSAGTTVYYTTTAMDTNQSGLPFPNVNLASYPSLNFSVDIAPTFSSSNVTAFLAVQLGGTDWYVSASPFPVTTTSDSSTYSTYTTAFNPTASSWKHLTVTGSGGTIGTAATSNLGGVMTGAGLVFVTVGTGGNFNFSNFVINRNGTRRRQRQPVRQRQYQSHMGGKSCGQFAEHHQFEFDLAGCPQYARTLLADGACHRAAKVLPAGGTLISMS